MKKSTCLVILVTFVIFVAAVLAANGQTFKTLVQFTGANGGNPGNGPLALGIDGNFYGITQFGGSQDAGTIFSMSPSGSLTTLYSFCSQTNCADGEYPVGGLLLGTDGNFYGTTTQGGAHKGGTLFKLTPQGSVVVLHAFGSAANCADGTWPAAPLIQAFDGNYYGTTEYGGLSCDGGLGSAFRLTASGQFTAIYSFDNGASPVAALVQAPDGNFYGTTPAGGSFPVYCQGEPGCGTVFKLTPSGMGTTLYAFCLNGNESCPDGAYPNGLALANDGNLYGTTTLGGGHGSGTIFRITTQGELTTVYSFCRLYDCPDGLAPSATLIQATDGNLYGSTQEGGDRGCFQSGCGTLFSSTLAGQVTTLHVFADDASAVGSDGENPNAELLQTPSGYFLGGAYQGAVGTKCFFMGCGTIFSQSMGLGPFITFVHNSGAIGQSIGILGRGLTGSTSVSFNGVPAEFTVVSDAFIKATVPSGATTGLVTVTTPNSVLTSNVQFYVLQ